MAALLGGFVWGQGVIMDLFQPPEFVLIVGMAFGSMVLSTPKKVLTRCFSKAAGALKGSHFSRQTYTDMLVMMFRLFSLARKWLVGPGITHQRT